MSEKLSRRQFVQTSTAAATVALGPAPAFGRSVSPFAASASVAHEASGSAARTRRRAGTRTAAGYRGAAVTGRAAGTGGARPHGGGGAPPRRMIRSARGRTAGRRAQARSGPPSKRPTGLLSP